MPDGNWWSCCAPVEGMHEFEAIQQWCTEQWGPACGDQLEPYWWTDGEFRFLGDAWGLTLYTNVRDRAILWRLKWGGSVDEYDAEGDPVEKRPAERSITTEE